MIILRKYWAIILLTAVTLVGGYVWRAQCGGFDADVEFCNILCTVPEWENNGQWLWQHVDTWSDVWSRWSECVDDDNARLAQLHAIVSNSMFPHWLSTLVNVLVLAFLPIAMLWLAGGCKALQRPILACALVFCFYFFVPWNDYFTSTAFFSNYFVAMAWWFLAAIMALNRRDSLWWRVATAVVVVLAAWWHEESGAMLCAFFAVYALLNGRGNRYLWLLSALCAIVVVGQIIGSPAMAEKFNLFCVEQEGRSITMQQWATRAEVWIGIALPMLYVCCVALVCAVGKWRRRLDWRLALSIVCAVLVGIAICWVTRNYRRALVPPVLVSLVGWAQLWMLFKPRVSRRLTMPAVVLFCSVYLGWLLYIAHWQGVINQGVVQMHRALYASGPSNVIFVDTLAVHGLPWTTFGAVPNQIVYGQEMVWAHQTPYVHTFPLLLPAEWRGTRYQQWPYAPGSRNLRGTHDSWVMNKAYDALRARVTFGAAQPAQTPWMQALRKATYGPGAIRLEVILQRDYIGLYPPGAPDADTLYRYWFSGTGISLVNVAIDSITLIDNRLSD